VGRQVIYPVTFMICTGGYSVEYVASALPAYDSVQSLQHFYPYYIKQ